MRLIVDQNGNLKPLENYQVGQVIELFDEAEWSVVGCSIVYTPNLPDAIDLILLAYKEKNINVTHDDACFALGKFQGNIKEAIDYLVNLKEI